MSVELSGGVKEMKENDRVPISSSSSIGTTTLRWVSACSTTVEHSQQEGFTE
jgi:hypothetical protein